MSDLSQTANITALSNPERIELLDAIRGFALLGILLMNLEAFTGPIIGAMTGIDSHLQSIDRWADAFIYIFVQGKFWTLFALLFGIGFAVMFERAKRQSSDFFSIYMRRLFALLVIGLIHLLLIWEGDILFSYALAGFVLLWLLKSGTTNTLTSIMVWYCSPLLLLAIWGYFTPSDANMQALVNEIANETRIFGHSSYGEVMQWRLSQFVNDFLSILFQLPMTVAMFMLGVWLYRNNLVIPLSNPSQKSLGCAALLWVSGLLLMLLSIWIAPEINPVNTDWIFAKINILNLLAGPLMCLGYFFGLRYLWSINWAQRILQKFAPLGKMALSNYLSQSIILTFIFYGYGLGYYQQLPRALHIPFALGLVILQILLSTWWLNRFSMGPIEYIWRWLTYGKRPKFVL